MQRSSWAEKERQRKGEGKKDQTDRQIDEQSDAEIGGKRGG